MGIIVSSLRTRRWSCPTVTGLGRKGPTLRKQCFFVAAVFACVALVAACAPPPARYVTTIATIAVGNAPNSVISDGTNIWVANALSNTVSTIGPVTNTVIATLSLFGYPTSVNPMCCVAQVRQW